MIFLKNGVFIKLKSMKIIVTGKKGCNSVLNFIEFRHVTFVKCETQ